MRRRGERRRRILRGVAWAAVYALGMVLLVPSGAWMWWQRPPSASGTDVNALWARHQWVGETHTDAEYRSFADRLRRNRITDVYFHAGPFEADGTVPESLHRNAAALLAALRRYAPAVRAQAYLGQIRIVDGHGIIDLDDPNVRRNVLVTDKKFLDLGFAGIHYDFEPIYPDDTAFLTLLDDTRALTKTRGRLLSVAIEQKTLDDAAQPIFKALLPRTGRFHYPPRPTATFLRAVADRADQVAIMAYDTQLPTKSLVGLHFAKHAQWTLDLIGDRTTVFLGVPTYRPATGWAEDLPTALRGIRKGIDALDRRPRRPFGVGIYADWTTAEKDWRTYEREWPGEKRAEHRPIEQS
ncbi:hypothetical protein BTM25_30470 [Actinomadura rubteroloni]|uniref:GH18 domain-containing protein n=1 Tax=Actinomadura rubteroloni TaxID=1926885 RepID=A0A2P4UHE1_9ACTN|nr:hypothetical protein [Actinomadura rubteroloni]POM24418.1 hypothetical protein BTM25_30470 [Actinomadura rubteroloni]